MISLSVMLDGKNIGGRISLGRHVKHLTNPFSSNLSTLNLKFFSNHGGICDLKENSTSILEINP